MYIYRTNQSLWLNRQNKKVPSTLAVSIDSETKNPNSSELGSCSERGARSLDLRVMNHRTEGSLLSQTASKQRFRLLLLCLITPMTLKVS